MTVATAGPGIPSPRRRGLARTTATAVVLAHKGEGGEKILKDGPLQAPVSSLSRRDGKGDRDPKGGA